MLKCQSLLKVSDEDDSMTVWNYTGDIKDENNKYRGCITDKMNTILCPSLGYTYEYHIDTKEESIETFKNFEQWKWFYATEGTMVRVFHYEGRWHLATHKKLSAFDSRWSCSLSFGELFTKSLKSIFYFIQEDNIYEWFLSQLETEKIYYFLVRSNQQNRIICHTSNISEKESLIYIGFRNRHNLKFSLSMDDTNSIFKEILNPLCVNRELRSIDELYDFVENNIDPFQYQGLVGFCNDNSDYQLIKVINSRYRELVQIRGNNHNLRLRYLEIRNDPSKVEKLFMLYPRHVASFEDFERLLGLICKKIAKTYIERYVQSKYVTLPKEEYIILRKCNEWCIKNNETVISHKKVLLIMNQESPINLFKMIQRFRNENFAPSSNHPHRKRFSNNFNNILSFYKITKSGTISSDGTLSDETLSSLGTEDTVTS